MGGQQLYAGICQSFANGRSGGGPDRREKILPDWIGFFHARFPIFGRFPLPPFADYGSRSSMLKGRPHVVRLSICLMPCFFRCFPTPPSGYFLGRHAVTLLCP